MKQSKKYKEDQYFSDDSDDSDFDSDQNQKNKVKITKQGNKKQRKKSEGINADKLKDQDQFFDSSQSFGRGKGEDFGRGFGSMGGGFGSIGGFGMGGMGGMSGMGGMGGIGGLGGMGGMGGIGGMGGMGGLDGFGGLGGMQKGRDHGQHSGLKKPEKKQQYPRKLRPPRFEDYDEVDDFEQIKNYKGKLGQRGYGGTFGDKQNGGGYGNRFKQFHDLDIRGLLGGKTKTKEKKAGEVGKQGEQQSQTEQQRLARLTKKLDIPQQQQITLVDWKIRGSSAEVIRLVLQYILIPYKQQKYDFLTKDQWYKIDQPNIHKTNVIIQLPYLKDGQKIVYGTDAIIIYILNKYNRTQLLGTTNDNKVRLYTIASIYWDLLQDYLQLCYGQYEQDLPWQKIKEKYINQRFRPKLNKILLYMKNRFSGTGEILWIDFAVYQLIAILNDMDYDFREYNIAIQNYLCKIQIIPQFIVYHRSYRYHERPYNGFGAIYK